MLKNIKNYALACLVLIFFVSCSAVDQAKFENLDRAVKSIQGATMTGVNYARFGELLQNLATEILITKDRVSTQSEKDLLGQYGTVYEVYKDSYEVWGYRLKRDERSSIVNNLLTREIASKYDLYVPERYIDHSRILQELWQVAGEVAGTLHGGRDAQQRAEAAAIKRAEETAQKHTADAEAARKQAEAAAAARQQAEAEAAAQQRAEAEAAAQQRAEAEATAAARQRAEEEAAAAAQRRTEMVRLPVGCFMMGSPASEADRDSTERQHRVCVETFEIGKYEVTQEEWQAVMGSNPSLFKRGDRHPVENVSWNDVQDYLQRLNQRTGQNYRLPTEAEWEYACRGGVEGQRYCGGNDADRVAWHGGNSDRQTQPVGRKAVNGFGLYDMSGNVYEWTCSVFDRNYGGAEQRCAGRAEDGPRSLRGGSWSDPPAWVRSAVRGGLTPALPSYFTGFRLARSL